MAEAKKEIGTELIVQIQKDLKKGIEAPILKTPEDQAAALDKLAKMKTYLKEKKAQRDAMIKPTKALIALFDAGFKKAVAPLEAAIDAFQDATIRFHEAQERKAAAANAKLAEKIEAAKEAGKEEKAATLALKEKVVEKTSEGTTFVKRWTAEVLDEKIIPREFLSVDQVKINQAVREGVRDIPGVKIYEKTIASTRSL